KEVLIKLLRDQILNLRCSLYSRTGALLDPNFGRSLHLIRASLIIFGAILAQNIKYRYTFIFPELIIVEGLYNKI
ncbi:MAG: hypothetical protein K2X63_01680, partial [Burkholderiaceae bacterium]|nr:hypothetical protein [Burkholderiaceae bacterium]